MLAPEDRQALQTLGYALLTDIAGFGTCTLCYGIFLLLFPITAWQFYTRRVRSLPAWIAFGTTIVGLILGSFYWIAYSVYAMTYLRFVTTLGSPSESKGSHLLAVMLNITLALIWARQIIRVLADAVVIWRAWVLCADCRWLMILPCSLLVGTVAMTFAFIGLTTTPEEYYNFIDGGKMRYAVNNAQGALSLLTNVSSTLVIAYRLWCFRQHWKQTMGNLSKWSRAQSVMLLMVESGAIYAVYLLLTIIGASVPYHDDTPFSYFANIAMESHVQVTAMYPTIVYLIVHHAASVENFTVWNASLADRGEALAQPLAAAGEPTALEALQSGIPTNKSVDRITADV